MAQRSFIQLHQISHGTSSFSEDEDPNEGGGVSTAVASVPAESTSELLVAQPKTYRLYRARFTGLIAMFALNFLSGMCPPWFGPLTNSVSAEFHVSLTRVNWLLNIIVVTYLWVAPFVPIMVARYGVRRSCEFGAVTLVLSAWVRFAATPHSLSVDSAYAIFMIGQLLSGASQPIFQVPVTQFSESWFDLKGRTTATMILSIANPLGAAVGQILSPIPNNTRGSILLLGILTSASVPFVFFVKNKPPTPPTYSGAQRTPSFRSFARAMLGKTLGSHEAHARMSNRERIDFAILALVFGALVGTTNTFSILSAQFVQPYGYSMSEAGFFGATLFLVGLLSAFVTAPLFDRYFTNHLGLTVKILCPIVGLGWLSLIWAVRRDNAGALFAIMAIIGAASVTILPVGVELGCELTRNPEGSSAVLWFAGNLFTLIFLLVENALRAPSSGHPPLNMHRALIFNGVIPFATTMLTFTFRGEQTRRLADADAGARRVAESENRSV